MDFQKIIVIEPKNPAVHVYAGNLLMTTGSYEDATKAFTNAHNIQKSPQALYQRARCKVALNQMQEALKDLNEVMELSPTDRVVQADRECLHCLIECSSLGREDEGAPRHEDYERAACTLTRLIQNETSKQMQELVHQSSIQHQHS